jgi:hypothetical protein
MHLGFGLVGSRSPHEGVDCFVQGRNFKSFHRKPDAEDNKTGRPSKSASE